MLLKKGFFLSFCHFEARGKQRGMANDKKTPTAAIAWDKVRWHSEEGVLQTEFQSLRITQGGCVAGTAAGGAGRSGALPPLKGGSAPHQPSPI